MSLNFSPYESPPSSPRAAPARTSLFGSTSGGSASRIAGGFLGRGNNASSTSSNGGVSGSSKSPWLSVGSYQSGARTSELAAGQGTGFGSSGAYQSDDVLWDAENGDLPPQAGPSSQPYQGGGGSSHDMWETATGARVDVEAAAAYALGPLLAIVLLILETKNDYVRFHSWQSLLLGAGLGVLHILLSWSRLLSWILLLLDMALYAHLAYRAFLDGDSLERYALPRIGELATRWTEEE